MILLALIWSRYIYVSTMSSIKSNLVKNTNDESQSVFFDLKVTKYTSSAVSRCILIVRQTRKKVLSRSSQYNYIQVQKQKTNKIHICTNHKHDSNKIQIKLTKHKTN